jgi:hypothetical protein
LIARRRMAVLLVFLIYRPPPSPLTWASQVVDNSFFHANVDKRAPVTNIRHISPPILQSLVFCLLLVIIPMVLPLPHSLDPHSISHHSLFPSVSSSTQQFLRQLVEDLFFHDDDQATSQLLTRTNFVMKFEGPRLSLGWVKG